MITKINFVQSEFDENYFRIIKDGGCIGQVKLNHQCGEFVVTSVYLNTGVHHISGMDLRVEIHDVDGLFKQVKSLIKYLLASGVEFVTEE